MSGKKEYISPNNPEDLMTCTSYMSRDLVAMYFKLGTMNATDAVATYIVAGVIEFGRKGLQFFDSEATIARSLGIRESIVRTYVGRLEERKIIHRKGQNGDQLKDRPWSVPGLKVQIETATHSYGHRNTGLPPTATQSHGGTATHSCGHLKEEGSERKKIKEERKEGTRARAREKPSCLPPVTSSSFFKEETKRVIKGYKLTVPDDLARAYYALVAHMTKGTINAKEEDAGYASKCLKSLPADHRRPEILSAWLTWYASRISPQRDKTWWLTSFSGSWNEFRPEAEKILKCIVKEEVEREREAKEQRRKEQAESEKQRQEELIEIEKTRREADRVRAEEEEKQRKKAREDFLAGLPSTGDIKNAVDATAGPRAMDIHGYYNWLEQLFLAVPLIKVRMERHTDSWLNTSAMLNEMGDDIETVITMTKKFVTQMSIRALKDIKADESKNSLEAPAISWDEYADHFGIDHKVMDAWTRKLKEDAAARKSIPFEPIPD